MICNIRLAIALVILAVAVVILVDIMRMLRMLLTMKRSPHRAPDEALTAYQRRQAPGISP